MPQLTGFVAASLVGTTIVLLAMQLYADMRSALTGRDSVIESTYVILSRQPEADDATFSPSDVADIAAQPFALRAAPFTASAYGVYASLTVGSMDVGTRMFFESVPDAFLDIAWPPLPAVEADGEWTAEVPVVVPRSYLSLYNFGFAPSQQLPRLTESLMGMLRIELTLTAADGRALRLPARVVGLTTRLNTVLVPEAFMAWSNRRLAPGMAPPPSRIIVEVAAGGTDAALTDYVRGHRLYVDDGSLEASRTLSLLRLVAAIVGGVGVLISGLAIALLMLSIFLLVQKNADKLHTLLLLGYPPARVARPYQLLTLALNIVATAGALAATLALRAAYLDLLWELFPQLHEASTTPTIVAAAGLCIAVSALHAAAIRAKINRLR